MVGAFRPDILLVSSGYKGVRMRRREFITLVAAAIASTGPAWSQSAGKRRLVAVLVEGRQTSFPLSASPVISSLLQGMSEAGYIEARDFDLAFRFADGDYARLPLLADELIALKPDLLMTSTVAGTLAIRRVTTTIPIVHPSLTEPVHFGFVESLARPGGQVTGLLATLDTLPGKQLQLALELLPGVTRIGVLINSSNPSMETHVRGAELAAHSLGVTLVALEVRLPHDLDRAFQTAAERNVGMVLVIQDAMFFAERDRLATFARIPTMYGFREHVAAGGLLSYGFSVRDNWRRAAGYIAKILNGARPGDLPIELPTKLEMAVNLKTAKALGLTIPPMLLARADEVFE